MQYIPGSQLCASDQCQLLRSYVHRYTKQHKPAWARNNMPNGKPYPVQFASDADWLANTLFAVKLNGRLDERVKSCRSTSTWPDNPELRGKVG